MSSKRYPQEFYNIAAILCLLQCFHEPLYYFDVAKLKKPSEYRQKLPQFDIFGILPNRQKLNGENFFKFAHILPPGTFFNSRPSVYIYSDFESPVASPIARRHRNLVTVVENQNLSNDLSLEDIDLIDCLWRQDIDVEKGVFTSIHPPEDQYQTDLALLSEKSLNHQPHLQLSILNINDGSKSQDELKKSFQSLFEPLENSASKKRDYAWLDGDFDWINDDAEKLQLPAASLENHFTTASSTGRNLEENNLIGQQPLAINDTQLQSTSMLNVLDDGEDATVLRNVTLPNALLNTTDEYAINDSILRWLSNESCDNSVMDWFDDVMSAAGQSSSLAATYPPIDEQAYDDAGEMTAATSSGSSSRAAMLRRPYFAATSPLPSPSVVMSGDDAVQFFSDPRVFDDVASEIRDQQKTGLPSTSRGFFQINSPTPSIRSGGSTWHYSNSHDMENVQSTSTLKESDENSDECSNTRSGERERTSSNLSGDSSTPSFSIQHDHQYCSNDEWQGQNYVEQIEIPSTSQTVSLRTDGTNVVNCTDMSDVVKRFRRMAAQTVASVEIDAAKAKAAKRRRNDGDDHTFFQATDHDVALARRYNLNIDVDDLVNLPTIQLQSRMTYFTETQREVARKIRRRARNKEAARQCRLRRSGVAPIGGSGSGSGRMWTSGSQLITEIDLLNQELTTLIQRRAELEERKQQLNSDVEALYSQL